MFCDICLFFFINYYITILLMKPLLLFSLSALCLNLSSLLLLSAYLLLLLLLLSLSAYFLSISILLFLFMSSFSFMSSFFSYSVLLSLSYSPLPHCRFIFLLSYYSFCLFLIIDMIDSFCEMN